MYQNASFASTALLILHSESLLLVWINIIDLEFSHERWQKRIRPKPTKNISKWFDKYQARISTKEAAWSLAWFLAKVKFKVLHGLVRTKPYLLLNWDKCLSPLTMNVSKVVFCQNCGFPFFKKLFPTDNIIIDLFWIMVWV